VAGAGRRRARSRLALALLATAVLLAAPPLARRSSSVPPALPCREDSRIAMGCTCTVRACGGDEAAVRDAVEAALDEVDRLDRLLSHYRDESPLSRLNREAARGPVTVDPELLAVLDLSLRFSRESEGAFDVTVGPLMKAWGFFRGGGRVPDAEERARALAVVGSRHVVLDREAGTVRFDRPGVELDLGGIGKGYAVDRAVALLRRRGIASALVNLGGSSVYGLGAPPGAKAWTIGIQDPKDARRIALEVALRDRALSVAGGYARDFERDGRTYAHIMDPRTGAPVEGVLSVAVLSADGTSGDALDDAFFVQGEAWTRRALARFPGTRVLFFLPGDRPGRWRLVRLEG
jgi:thiamine biosynthesis lipoprotein